MKPTVLDLPLVSTAAARATELAATLLEAAVKFSSDRKKLQRKRSELSALRQRQAMLEEARHQANRVWLRNF